MTLEQRDDVQRTWHNLRETSLVLVELKLEDFLAAARFAERYELGLRASDALHIAVAYFMGYTLVTLDKRMAEAAVACGVVVKKV